MLLNETKKEKVTRKSVIRNGEIGMWKTRQEFSTMTLYNSQGMWRSLVARLFWVQNVTGSNPVIPTYYRSVER